jgi:hypothetical protein
MIKKWVEVDDVVIPFTDAAGSGGDAPGVTNRSR